MEIVSSLACPSHSMSRNGFTSDCALYKAKVWRRECGVILEDRTRQYCDDCLPDYREAQASSFSDAGRAKLRELREAGTDPSQTGEATEKRRAVMTQRRREEAEWNAAHVDRIADESIFRTEILPTLQGLSLSTIVAATGLSQQYCSLIRRGLKVPHTRHWPSLSALLHCPSSPPSVTRQRVQEEG